jgi:hypothetical protein
MTESKAIKPKKVASTLSYYEAVGRCGGADAALCGGPKACCVRHVNYGSALRARTEIIYTPILVYGPLCHISHICCVHDYIEM